MWKKFLAASAVASGIIGLLGGGSAFADLPEINSGSYAPGQTIYAVATNSKICINKNGGYDGDLIIADIWGTNFRKQITFDSFSGDESCKLVGGAPSDGRMRFVTPMGLSNMTFFTQVEDGYVDGEIYLNLNNATTSNKYVCSYGNTTTRTAKSVATITLDTNGGSGIVPVITGIEIGSSVTLPKNTLTRTGYKFAGWNTKADGTGTPYADEATIAVEEPGQIQLFAQWQGRAVLHTGRDVNFKLKKLADANVSSYSAQDANIKAIKAASALPEGFDTSNNANIISADATTSPEPIYAWFDNADNNNDGAGDGIIYLYTNGIVEGGSDMSDMFFRVASLTDISALASWDTSSVTNMEYMFNKATSLTDISALASWDTSSVTNMSKIFSNASSLTDISALASWNISGVTNMEYMFSDATSLTDISALASWNTSSATSMQGMFYQTKITNVDALETRQHDGKDYVSWDTSSVTNMSGMFLYARSLADISTLASWDTSSVTDMRSTFEGTNSLADISALASWDTSSVTDMGYMFESSGGITNVDALETKQHDGKDYVSWDTSKVTYMGHMFAHIASLTDISALASWNTSSVTVMDHMFTGAGGITNVDALETKRHDGKDYVSWDTSKVTNMEYMFWGVTSLTDISALASWDTSNVTNMSGMFYQTKITNVDALETKQHDGKDYVSWDTSGVTNMSMMFQYATSLADISALASWDTSRVTNMSAMFRDTAITNVDELETKRYEGKNYTSWDVSHVTDMSWMFRGTRLTDISALASWNTSSVKNLYAMFARTGTLGDASVINGWDVSHVTDMKEMFARSSANPLPSWYHY